MARDWSQISVWLKAARVDAGLTQQRAAELSKVGIGTVTSAEQGREPKTLAFLALVSLYGAELELAQLLKRLRADSRVGETLHHPPALQLHDATAAAAAAGRGRTGRSKGK